MADHSAAKRGGKSNVIWTAYVYHHYGIFTLQASSKSGVVRMRTSLQRTLNEIDQILKQNSAPFDRLLSLLSGVAWRGSSYTTLI